MATLSKAKKISIYGIVLLCTVLICTVHSQQNDPVVQNDVENNENTNNTVNELIPVPNWLNSSQSEYERFMLDKYNYFVTSNGNKVWACAMSLAWNELKRSFLAGQNATFSALNELQQKQITNLNS